MTSIPSNRYGNGGIVIRRSWAAIATAAAASPRSWASMKPASRARSSSVGSPADQSDRRAGRCACIVARARWSALFVAATVVSRRDAVSLAGQPSTSRAIRVARCRGGKSCIAARNASSIVSRSTISASGCSALGATSSRSRSGYGWSHGTSANVCSFERRRLRLRMASRQTFVAIR